MAIRALPTIESLSLRQLIGQMIVVRSSGHLFDGERLYPQWEADQQTLQTWIQEFAVGGVILLGGSAAEISLKTQQLQAWAEIPLLIAADIEEGVGQRFAGATWFPPPMALAAIWRDDPQQAIALAEQMGEITAKEALSIGVNWILAPVMDVNNNPANPVINVRAFGETPAEVADLGAAFIRGANKYAALTTAKHFPGHGDTAMDSHLSLPTIPHDLERLQQVELPPFQAAIASGVDTVMTAHLMISALDTDRPATLSPNILTDLLREQLHFDGLIVTDALMMAGVTTFADPAEVAVLAIEAGADILLMPPDVEGAIAAVEQAIITGRLTQERIQQSVTRIWQAKQKLQTDQPPTFPQAIATTATQPIVQKILTQSQQTNHQPCYLPQYHDQPAQNLIIVDSFLKSDFLKPNCPAIAIPQQQGYQPQILELRQLQHFNLEKIPTVVQLFTRGNPFTGTLGNPNNLLKDIGQQTELLAILIYGTPYFLPKTFQYHSDIPCLFSYGQMAIAQTELCKALWAKNKTQTSNSQEFT